MSTPSRYSPRHAVRVEMAKLFIARGADPDESDAEPRATPLAWAERMDRPEIVQLLNSAKPRPSA